MVLGQERVYCAAPQVIISITERSKNTDTWMTHIISARTQDIRSHHSRSQEVPLTCEGKSEVWIKSSGKQTNNDVEL